MHGQEWPFGHIRIIISSLPRVRLAKPLGEGEVKKGGKSVCVGGVTAPSLSRGASEVQLPFF